MSDMGECMRTNGEKYIYDAYDRSGGNKIGDTGPQGARNNFGNEGDDGDDEEDDAKTREKVIHMNVLCLHQFTPIKSNEEHLERKKERKKHTIGAIRTVRFEKCKAYDCLNIFVTYA